MSEHLEQCAVFDFARYAGIRLFAIPNGGHRHKAVAVKLRAEGVCAGVPDLMVPEAHGGFNGLFI